MSSFLFLWKKQKLWNNILPLSSFKTQGRVHSNSHLMNKNIYMILYSGFKNCCSYLFWGNAEKPNFCIFLKKCSFFLYLSIQKKVRESAKLWNTFQCPLCISRTWLFGEKLKLSGLDKRYLIQKIAFYAF